MYFNRDQEEEALQKSLVATVPVLPRTAQLIWVEAPHSRIRSPTLPEGPDYLKQILSRTRDPSPEPRLTGRTTTPNWI